MPEAIKSAFLTSRPFSWINTSFPFVAGWLTAGTPLGWPFWLGVFFFLVPYNLAMYGINDIYDYESDLQNPPKASIEGALLNPSQFRRLWSVILLLGLPPAAVLLGVGPAASKLLLLFSLFMVVAYSAPPFRFKEKPLLDSFTSSCHFVTPLLYGVLLAGGRLSSIAPIIAAYFLWGMASHAFGAVQDVPFDREAGIGSVARVIGSRLTVLFSTSLYVVAAVLVCAAYPTTPWGSAGHWPAWRTL